MRWDWIAATTLLLGSSYSGIVHADDHGATYLGGVASVASDGAVSDSLSSNVNPATTVLTYSTVGAEAGVRYRWLRLHGGFGFGRVGGDETTGSEIELRLGADARVMSGHLGLVGRFDVVVVDASYHFQSDVSFIALGVEPRGGLEVQFTRSCWADVLVGPRAKLIASSSEPYANPQWGWSVGLGVFYSMD